MRPTAKWFRDSIACSRWLHPLEKVEWLGILAALIGRLPDGHERAELLVLVTAEIRRVEAALTEEAERRRRLRVLQ